MIWGVPRWAEGFRLEALGEADSDQATRPSLSICVPARDEALHIERCVQSALAVDYSPLELVVVDDRSSDETASLAEQAAAGDQRFRLISGQEPEAGWAGKSFACQQAAAVAKGELLLFIDADVSLAPWVVSAAVRHLQKGDHGLLSLFGDWRLLSFWERVLVPVVGWFIRGAVDFAAVNDPARAEAFANGQFILVRRAAYESIGGHGAVRDQVLDDLRLARAFKAGQHSTALLAAPGGFSVRLYDSLGSIVRGYEKNLYEGMDRRPGVALAAMAFIATGSVLPALALLGLWAWLGTAAALASGWLSWLAAIVLASLLFRWRVERRDGRSGWAALTHPLGNALLVWILFRSMRVKQSTWKGRSFVDGRAS